jgi:hypothetical protein
MGPTLIVTPDSPLFQHAVRVGLERFLDSRNRKDRAGARKSLKDDLMGALAEAILALYTHQVWHATVGQFQGQMPDVGDDIEVRYTHHPNGRLLLRPGDSLDRRWALVTGPFPPEWRALIRTPLRPHHRPAEISLTLHGWLPGAEVATPELETAPAPDRPPCWAAPQRILRPLSTLQARP